MSECRECVVSFEYSLEIFFLEFLNKPQNTVAKLCEGRNHLGTYSAYIMYVRTYECLYSYNMFLLHIL